MCLFNVTSSVKLAVAGDYAGSCSVPLDVMTLKNDNQHWLWSDNTGFAEGDRREATVQSLEVLERTEIE